MKLFNSQNKSIIENFFLKTVDISRDMETFQLKIKY